jgi:hypothetical protein
MMILRYDPRVSLISALENQDVAVVRAVVMSQMTAAFTRGILYHHNLRFSHASHATVN